MKLLEKIHYFGKEKILNITLLILFLNILFSRLYHYISYKSFWLDESSIALSIYNSSWINILQGKNLYNQSCPIFFAVINKIISIITDFSPYALYLLPTIFGCLFIFLIYDFCVKYTSKIHGFICLFIVSLCEMPLYYSSEFKQYIYEALCTIVILNVLFKDLSKDSIDSFISFKYPILFSIILLISSTSIFISFGMIISISIYLIKKEYSFKMLLKLYINRYLIFFVLFIIYYSLYLKNSGNEFMYNYWNKYFIPININEFIEYFYKIFWPMFTGMFQVVRGIKVEILAEIIAFFFFIGAYSIYKTDKIRFLSVILPFCLAFFAAFKIYPLGHSGMIGARLSFYLFPLIILISGYGIFLIFKLIIDNISIIEFSIICILFLLCVIYTSFLHIKHGIGFEDSFPLFQKVNKEYTQNDLIILHSGGKNAFEYWQIFNKTKIPYLVFDRNHFKNKNSVDITKIKQFDIEEINKKEKIYIIYTHFWDKSNKIIEKFFTSKGFIVESIYKTGAILQKIYKK